MKKLLVLAAALALTGAVVAQTVPDAPSLRAARQRASYQVARIANAMQQDSIALYHAQRLYSMLDSMVVADSIANLPPPPADSLAIGWMPMDVPASTHWGDVDFGYDFDLGVGHTRWSCVYGVHRETGAFVSSAYPDRCPNPSDIYPLPPMDHEVRLWVQQHVPDHVTAQ